VPPPAYLDECVDRRIAPVLRKRGFDVALAGEHGPRGVDDEAQLLHAATLGRAIVSYNARHFERWHRLFLEHGRRHAGIVLVPDTGPMERIALRVALLLDWITEQETDSRLFRWGQLQLTLTQGHRLGDRYSEDEIAFALGH
jgi:hypothetical protein